jgi:hypothetical protein
MIRLSFTIVAGPSPAGLMTTFYCLRFGAPPTWRVLFSSPLTTRRATVKVFDASSTRESFLLGRVESYVTTDGQSASVSWNKAPIWGLRPDIYYCHKVVGLMMRGSLSLGKGWVCRLQLLLGLASAIILG